MSTKSKIINISVKVIEKKNTGKYQLLSVSDKTSNLEILNIARLLLSNLYDNAKEAGHNTEFAELLGKLVLDIIKGEWGC